MNSSVPQTFWFLVGTSLAQDHLPHLPRRAADGQLHGLCRTPRIALIQDRVGPNRTGFPLTLIGFKKDFSPFLGGLGQPIADAVKFLLKEDFVPGHVNKLYFWLAPCLAMIPSIVVLAAIPFGSSFLGVPMVVAPMNVGILFIFAISSVGVYGIVLAGWSSNSKYPFLGGIRSTSQMISYELGLGLSAVPVLLIAGTTDLSQIIAYQVSHGWLLFPFTDGHLDLHEFLLWIPAYHRFRHVHHLDVRGNEPAARSILPESETELVAGYHTEYSSMKFALFFLGEYTAMIAGSALIVVLFLGGWHLPSHTRTALDRGWRSGGAGSGAWSISPSSSPKSPRSFSSSSGCAGRSPVSAMTNS